MNKYQTLVGWFDKDRSELKERKPRKPQKRRKQITTSYGYILRHVPTHHFADKRGYVRVHRYVWEIHNKASLLPWALVYHIDGNKQNNDVSNLRIATEFTLRHRRGPHSLSHFVKKLCEKYGLED